MESELMKNARLRAEKRATERSLTGNVTGDRHERFEFDNNSIVVNEQQERTINLILAGCPVPPTHRPVFPRGAGPNAVAGVPLLNSAFGPDNTDFSKQVEVEYLDSEYNWPERYDREDPPALPAKIESLNIDFEWPGKNVK